MSHLSPATNEPAIRPQYRPLDSTVDEIRLLNIPVDSNSVKDNEPLRCTLEYVQSRPESGLKEAKSNEQDLSPWGIYEALSYEWGITEPKQSILLDDQPFEVTPNLFGALREVQWTARDEDRQSIRLWVDAICIDQMNIEERNNQVSRMRYIYSFANTVYCYLTPYPLSPNDLFSGAGDQTFDFDTDMDHAAALLPLAEELPIEESFASFAGIESNFPDVTTYDWFTLLRFLCNTYWARLWVAQEIVLASRQIFVLAGPHQIDFEHVQQAAIVMCKGIHALGHLIDEAFGTSINVMPGCTQLMGIVRQRKSLQESGTLGSIETVRLALRTTMAGLCTDPRDRVYGTLGIMSRDQVAKVSVDYSDPVEQVYTDFATAVIGHTHSLGVLALSYSTCQNTAEMPSWVPDLRKSSVPILDPYGNFNASSMMSHLPSPRIVSKDQLRAPGLFIDRIDGLAAADAYESVDRLVPLDAVPVSDTGRMQHQYNDFHGLMTAFWNTLVLREDQNAKDSLSLCQRQLEAIYDTSPLASGLQRFFQRNRDFVAAGYAIKTFFVDPPNHS